MLVGLKLQVGRLCAPEGEAVSLHARFIVPAYVLAAERVMVVVTFPPGDTEDGAGAESATWETVTTVLPVPTPYVASPE
jgi:hypothetical protein